MNEEAPEYGRGSASEVKRETPPPRIYVASLSDYNVGRLHGSWLDADQNIEDLQSEVDAMLTTSLEPGAEEWAIHDYEGFGPVELSEYESLENVTRLARGIAEHGPAYAAWAAWVGLADTAPEVGFDDAFLGHWQSVEEYAEQLLDDMGATEALAVIPDWLQGHVQLHVAGFARDLELGGDIWTASDGEGGVWVFDGQLGRS